MKLQLLQKNLASNLQKNLEDGCLFRSVQAV